MRISSAAMHASAVLAMQQQQQALARTQQQVATGKRVLSPADDPIAAVRILDIERAQAQAEQFGKNSDIARNRLSLEEQALADSTTLMQRVRELLVQAGNVATLSDADRASIALETGARLQELRDIANRQDGNGEYLFAGYSTQTQPFSVSPSGAVVYAGDQGGRLLQIGPDQRIADSDAGHAIFMAIPEGNGTFVTGVAPANTGTGVIGVGSVANPAAWVADDYTLEFSSASTWEVRNSANALVTSGTYAAGGAVAFNGIQVHVTGVPAAGDRFTISQAGTKDAFGLLGDITRELGAATSGAADRAQLGTFIGGALQQIDQALTQVQGTRSAVGARLSRLETADQAREDYTLELKTSLSELQELDYAEAVSRMNQQLVSLQAAQAAYARLAQLSLFNFI